MLPIHYYEKIEKMRFFFGSPDHERHKLPYLNDQ